MSRRNSFFRRPRPTIEPTPARRPFRTDARRGEAGRRTGTPAPDPERERRERLRRRVSRLMLGTLFAFGLLAAVFGERGYVDVARSRGELSRLAAETETQRQRVAELSAYVERLREDPAALERIAREDLGLTRPGEVVFLLPREPGSEER